jgi:hypothetical protein
VELRFVGIDPDSPLEKCPAVHVDPETGDGYFVGKIVKDHAVIAEMSRHGAIAADEGVFRMPAQMWPIIKEAAEGTYEPDREGPGEVPFEGLVAAAQHSVARLEMREIYDRSDPAYQRWCAGSRVESEILVDGFGWWRDLVTSALARGVQWRRLRVVPEPLTEYLRWEHHLAGHVNVGVGEELRWLSARNASDLLLPVNDLWCFDRRTVQFQHFSPQGDENVEFDRDEVTGDLEVVERVMSAFEHAWERAVPHEQYLPR